MSNIAIEERIKWVGASEVASLFEDTDPYTTRFELWHQKAGLLPRTNLDGNERVEAGRFLEPAIGQWANHKWGMSLKNVSDYLVHPHVARMGASLDFTDAEGACVEIKNVDGLVFRDQWAVDGEDVIDAPLKFLVQVQAQMACAPSAPHGWLIACVGGNKLYRLKIERNPALIEAIEYEVAEFWESVDAGKAPLPDFENDGRALASIYAVGNGRVVDLRNNNRMPQLCAAHIAAKKAEKAAKNESDRIMGEIRITVGDAQAALVNGFTVKRTNIKETIIAAYHRDAYSQWTIKPTDIEGA